MEKESCEWLMTSLLVQRMSMSLNLLILLLTAILSDVSRRKQDRSSMNLPASFLKIEFPKLIPVSSSEFEQPACRPQYSELINTKLPKMRHWQDALEEYLQTIQALGK